MTEQDPKSLHQPKAVALFYDGVHTPELTAVGHYLEAERIIALAREHRIPIYENPALVEILARQEEGSAIPPELYQVIAELIAFVYRLENRQPVTMPEPHKPQEEP